MPPPPAAAPVAPAPTPHAPAPQVAPAPDPYADPTLVAGAPASPPPSRFVFAFLPALTFGLSSIPSANLSFFFGGRLQRSPWALGFQFTFSSGFAERYLTGLLTHRYHVTGLTRFGAGDRGFASVGGGVAVRMFSPLVEVEGRVGLRFGDRRNGIVGAVFRLGYDFAHREGAPVPQLGLVLGVSAF